MARCGRCEDLLRQDEFCDKSLPKLSFAKVRQVQVLRVLGDVATSKNWPM